MKIKVCSDKELFTFIKLRKEIRDFYSFSLNQVYEYILIVLKSLDNKFRFFDKIIEIIKNIEHFENLVKSKYFYDKNDKWIKNKYKEMNVLYPEKRIRWYYKDNEITINKRFDSNDFENRLQFKNSRLDIRSNYECNEVIAIDTETFEGCCKLLCRNENGNNRKKNYILNPSFDECLDFLIYHINNKNVQRFMFNIDFDIQAILKLYPYSDKLDFIDKLSKGITMSYKNKKHTYYFTWIRSKMFQIKVKGRKKRPITFTDLYTFYNLSLGKAGKKYLKSTKDKINGNKLNTDLKYWKKKEKDIIKYCIKDCNLTKNLGWLLVNTIKENGLLTPKFLVSPASISKQNFRYKNYIPSLKHTSIKVIQIAFDCYFGGRFEVFKRGFINNANLYDIVSQYPKMIRDLPDLFNGLWYQYKDLKELPKSRCLGYFKCLVKIPMTEKIPTLPIKYKGLVCFPNGTFLGWFTWFDLDLMRKYIISIKKAIIFKPNSNNYFPFRKKIDELVDKKKSIDKDKNSMSYNTVKICMNGLYGCFIEKHDKFYLDDNGNIIKRVKAGILFNPIYASQITAFGRWSVIKDIPKIKRKHIIAIHTDSIMTDIDMSKYLEIGKNLGNWNLESSGKTLIIGTGLYQIGKLVKTRGIPKKLVKDWFKIFSKNKDKKKIAFTIKHMKKVREAIIQDKSVINMNKMFDIERNISCNSDLKRTWNDEFKDFNDLKNRNISSLPYYSFENEFGLSLNPIIISQMENIPLNQTYFILKESGY